MGKQPTFFVFFVRLFRYFQYPRNSRWMHLQNAISFVIFRLIGMPFWSCVNRGKRAQLCLFPGTGNGRWRVTGPDLFVDKNLIWERFKYALSSLMFIEDLGQASRSFEVEWISKIAISLVIFSLTCMLFWHLDPVSTGARGPGRLCPPEPGTATDGSPSFRRPH